MSEKDVLSQEEIDALLHTVDDTEADKELDPTDEAEEVTFAIPENIDTNGDQVQTINFSTQERIVKGQLPVLDKVHDRAIHLFAADIYQLTGKDFEIIQEPLSIVKYRDFMQNLPNPSLMSIYRFRPLRGKVLIVFDSTFVYDLVDYYFGGSTQFMSQNDRTDFTATELRVMDSVNKKLVQDLLEAWKPIMSISIVKLTDETNPQMVNIGELNDMLLVTRFSINFGKETGSFHIVIPYLMLEPIKQQLELGASRPDEEIDPNWIKSLRTELMEVELHLSATMSETKSTLGRVMDWKIGEFISLDGNETVEVSIEGCPSFKATLGTAGEKRALKIIEKIKY